MRKKLSILLLAILIIPAFALLGCGNATKYEITATRSDSTLGTVEGAGTFVDGSEVSLTATAKSTSAFVAWVFNGKILSQDNTYKITDTKNGEVVLTSTLKFNSNSSTQGNYTAVFKDANTLYTKLEKWMISKSQDATPEDDSSAKEVLIEQFRVSVSQGNSYATEIYDSQPLDVKENVETQTQTIDVLKFDNNLNNQKIKVDLIFGNIQRTFRAEIAFQNSIDTVEDLQNGYSYKTTYSNGTYKIEITFDRYVEGQVQNLYLTVIYKNLGE